MPLVHQLLLSFIQCRPNTLNVLNHVGVTDVAKDGQVDHVGQEQVIQLNSDSVAHAQRQVGAAAEGQIDVGTIPIIAFGTRAVQNCFFHLRVADQDGANLLDDRVCQAAPRAGFRRDFHNRCRS